MRPNSSDLATLSTSGSKPSPLPPATELPRPREIHGSGVGLRLVAAATVLLTATLAVAVGIGWHLSERNRAHPSPVEPPSEETSASVPSDRPPSVSATRVASVPIPEVSKRGAASVPEPASDEPNVPERGLSPGQLAKARVATAMKELEGSGPANAALTAAALKSVENLKRTPGLANAEFSEFRCFGDGCAVTVTGRDANIAEMNGESIIRSQDFFLWPGPKFRSGPMETPAGQVQTVVILYRNRMDTPPTTQRPEEP